jgi:hypothetical protein
MRKSNHSVEDVRIIDKMTEVSFGNQEDQYRLMDIAQQPNTSNETQNSDVNMVEVRVQTPVSRPKGIKGSPPEGNDGAPKNKRKRKARNAEVKDTVCCSIKLKSAISPFFSKMYIVALGAL